MTEIGLTLDAEVDHAQRLVGVRKTDLNTGDCVLVTTRNSRYTIWALGDGCYWVWGGWFDRRQIAPQRVGINGCTWGGGSIKRDIVAAPGLLLEFTNSVLTTRIRQVRVLRAQPQVTCN